ncbi:uncharacterized protein CMC5_032030 [Chondromyces crocatus]|uniref:Uncharacterized protein n=2 Tax=Chondromyces crocatus TaxID=52 RepID=A0A0K1EEF7_CHOCO|nr:uncharacterized protein CMC5_032030 [Chondromyces crocatus]
MEHFDPNLSDARRPRGGLCTVRGRRVILVDACAALPDRIATVAAALSRIDLDALYLPPIVRATIGAHASLSGAMATQVTPTAREARPLPPVRARLRDEPGERFEAEASERPDREE